MVGVPRSKRCQRCKRIKVKCDENWPTCTPCARAKVPCSGPVNLTKFISQNDHHAKRKNESKEAKAVAGTGIMAPAKTAIPETPSGNLESIRTQDLPGGATFGHFRLSEGPRKNLTTVADRVAARMVGYLAHDDAPWDMMASIGYSKHLPIRLAESAALRDTVALMCSAWSNYRRNLPANQVIDPNMYGKALRSLQRALNDRAEQLNCETLASATILARLELWFGTNRPHQMNHAEGIQALMLRRGPPSLEDDLDLQLALENHATLLTHWIVSGEENFYFSEPWAKVIQGSAPVLHKTVSSERRECYEIGYFFGFWPGLVQELRQLSNNPDIISQLEQATALQDRAADIEADVRAISEPITRRARREGRVVELPNPGFPVGSKFEFSSLDTMAFYLSYVMIRTVLNRVQYHAAAFLGIPDPLLTVEHRDICKQTWMCMPFVKGLGMMPAVSYATPLYLTYEGADEDEKEYLLDYIIEIATYKGRVSSDREAIERFVLNAAKALTGRSQFV